MFLDLRGRCLCRSWQVDDCPHEALWELNELNDADNVALRFLGDNSRMSLLNDLVLELLGVYVVLDRFMPEVIVCVMLLLFLCFVLCGDYFL